MKRIPQVGDKYKCVGEGWNAPIGAIIEITGVNDTGCYISTSYRYDGRNGCWSFTSYPDDFEYIPETQQFEGKHFINVKAYAEKYKITLKKAHEEIQPKLFELGYDWWRKGKETSPKNVECLDLNCVTQNEISHSCVAFKDHKYMAEIVIEREEVVTLKLSVKEAPKEYVEFNGKQYEKAKLEQALKLIEGDE